MLCIVDFVMVLPVMPWFMGSCKAHFGVVSWLRSRP